MTKGNSTRPLSRFAILLLPIWVALFPFTANATGTLEERVKEYKLDNGLQIIVLKRTGSPTFSAYIRFLVGAVDENVGETGIAHILEHMLFKGSENIGTRDFSKEKLAMNQVEKIAVELDELRREKGELNSSKIAKLKKELQKALAIQRKQIIKDEISSIYSRNGSDGFNAFTSKDTTTYLVKLPANKLELWAWIESDRLRSPVLREFYSERDVVMEERRRSVDNSAGGTLYEQFLSTAFSAHPYGRPIIGWESDISFLPKKSVKKFLKTYYSPNNMVICIVGDVEPDNVYKTIKKYFSDIPPQEIPSRVITKEPKQRGERRVFVEFDANPEVMIGFHKPTVPHKDDYVIDVIDSVLAQGRTSRLYKSLVLDKEIAVSVSAWGSPGSRYDNLYAFHITPRSPHTTEEVERALYDELDRMKKEPVTKQELQKVINNMEAEFVRRLRSNSGIAHYISEYQILLGDWRYMVNYIDEIKKITPEDIIAAAKKYFVQSNRTVATLVPSKRIKK